MRAIAIWQEVVLAQKIRAQDALVRFNVSNDKVDGETVAGEGDLPASVSIRPDGQGLYGQ